MQKRLPISMAASNRNAGDVEGGVKAGCGRKKHREEMRENSTGEKLRRISAICKIENRQYKLLAGEKLRKMALR
jgi:hypothetical protein